MLPLASLSIKTLKECRPGELVIPQGHKYSAFVAQVKGGDEKDRGLILLKPGEIKWENGFVRFVVSLQLEWELRVDLWDQCTLGPSNLQKTTGAIGLYGQRALMMLDGGRCCDLTTCEVLKFPDNLGNQTATLGKWEIWTKTSQPAETSQTLYAFSCA
jgi:hypothetical protein